MSENEIVEPIRILLADDHALVRQGTRELLDKQADLEVVAEAGDGREAVQLAIKKRPDVVTLDQEKLTYEWYYEQAKKRFPDKRQATSIKCNHLEYITKINLAP